MKTLNASIAVFSLVLASLIAAPASADKIYQTTDADGNPEFSDAAPGNAKQLDVPNTQTYQALHYAQENQPFKAVRKKTADTGPPYKVIRITYPKDQTSIRNNAGNVRIAYQVSPGAKPGYRLELVMDGKPMQQVSGGGAINLNNVDRGTHTVQIQAFDMQTGKVVQSSDPVAFTLHRHSILQKKPKI